MYIKIEYYGVVGGDTTFHKCQFKNTYFKKDNSQIDNSQSDN